MFHEMRIVWFVFVCLYIFVAKDFEKLILLNFLMIKYIIKSKREKSSKKKRTYLKNRFKSQTFQRTKFTIPFLKNHLVSAQMWKESTPHNTPD